MRENRNLSSILNQNLLQNQNLSQMTMERVLRRYIGRKSSCEFYIDDELIKKTGILTDVGADYITLTSINNPDEILISDLENLKFIKIS
ncbi:MAG: hypothetical protein IJX99_04845 [Clostridia bacterium]|nr:hypothetical protein [Clostridia bacterium]